MIHIMTHFRELPPDEWCVQHQNGISFQLAMIAPFKTLQMLFGNPRDPSKISYNSRYEWDVVDTDSGVCCTIYEWISKGVMPKNYPSDADIRSAPEYKWNIGASQLGNAMALLDWLKTRDPSIRRIDDWADPLSFAAERRRVLMKDYTIQELRDVIDKYDIYVPDKTNKAKIVEAIVEAETRKQCGL